MLNINSLKRLYYLPDVHDMRFNEETIMVFIKATHPAMVHIR